MTKSPNLKNFKSQYRSKFVRYGTDFLHVIIILIGFKISFINTGSQKDPLLISRLWCLAPAKRVSYLSQASGLKGLIGFNA